MHGQIAGKGASQLRSGPGRVQSDVGQQLNCSRDEICPVNIVDTLVACGVEEGQGYLVSPPLPFARFDEFLMRHQAQALAEDMVRSAARVA